MQDGCSTWVCASQGLIRTDLCRSQYGLQGLAARLGTESLMVSSPGFQKEGLVHRFTFNYPLRSGRTTNYGVPYVRMSFDILSTITVVTAAVSCFVTTTLLLLCLLLFLPLLLSSSLMVLLSYCDYVL